MNNLFAITLILASVPFIVWVVLLVINSISSPNVIGIVAYDFIDFFKYVKALDLGQYHCITNRSHIKGWKFRIIFETPLASENPEYDSIMKLLGRKK